MKKIPSETRSKKAPKPFIPPAGKWVIGCFSLLLGGTFFCLFDVPHRVASAVGKIHFSLPSLAAPKSDQLTAAQAAFDYPTKIREAADLMQDTGNRILESATDSAKAKELIFRARLKSRSQARSAISANSQDILISKAVGFGSLGAIGECRRLFEEIPPPPKQWEMAHYSLKSMLESLNEVAASCDRCQARNTQRHFQGVENDPLLDDPEFFEADLDLVENKVSAIRWDHKLITKSLPD